MTVTKCDTTLFLAAVFDYIIIIWHVLEQMIHVNAYTQDLTPGSLLEGHRMQLGLALK